MRPSIKEAASFSNAANHVVSNYYKDIIEETKDVENEVVAIEMLAIFQSPFPVHFVFQLLEY